ncbi:MAG: MBL fold metallo-hydrolase [Lachnospiraceae bacterium]|nr:MBL fold metallo-hydrolase [Lachnospiraceae bacterium]
MRLTALGTQSPYSAKGHNCISYLIDDEEGNLIMLDCGSGSHSMLEYPKCLDNLSVIISYLHRDHFNDIYNIQYASFVFKGQDRVKNPVNIYLPKTPLSISEDICNEEAAFAEYHIINENSTLNIGDNVITFCRTDHPGETYAIRIENKGKVIAYTADTSYSAKERIIDFVKDADILISEASLLEEYGFPEISRHLTAKQAAIIAKEANVSKLLLTHFWPEEDLMKYEQEAKKVFINTKALQEGDTF